MASYLILSLTQESYSIIYKEEGDVLLEVTKKYGLHKLEDFKLRERASYLLLDPLLFVLEKISLYERIPTALHVVTSKHGTWIKHILESYPYTQFYTSGKKMSVILEKVQGNMYAGHQKKTLNFKI
jgi:hypothetical protein